jgi:hypothetical protein
MNLNLSSGDKRDLIQYLLNLTFGTPTDAELRVEVVYGKGPPPYS